MDDTQTIDGLPILKKTAPTTDEGLPIFKKKSPAPILPSGSDLSPSGLNPFQNTPQDSGPIAVLPQYRDNVVKQQKADAHSRAIDTAQQQRQLVQPNASPKEDRSIMDQVGQAAYLPAIKQGFNDLIVKPLAGATDFVDRTIDKAYQGVTGEKTPDWLREGKDSIFKSVSKQIQNEYDTRDKPTNMVSDIAEGVAGTLPLMASMFTGQGETSMAMKAPQLFGKLSKTLAVTHGLSAYHDATENGQGYASSLASAGTEAAKGGLEGQFMDAQMLVGGALGKGTANKLAEYGLLKGGKAGKALIHALSVGTIFGGTSAGEDLLSGKDINTDNVLKQFGTGLAFEAIPTAKGINDELKDRKEGDKINTKAAQAATVSSAASNLNGESAVRTLINTPIEQIQQIHSDIKEGYEDLYANSLANGVKAFDAKDIAEKRDLYAQQLALKAQGDIKLIADKVSDPKILEQLKDEIYNNPELTDEQVKDLHDKIDVLTPQTNEQAKTNTEVSVEQQEDETTSPTEITPTVDATSGDSQVTHNETEVAPKTETVNAAPKVEAEAPVIESPKGSAESAELPKEKSISTKEHTISATQMEGPNYSEIPNETQPTYSDNKIKETRAEEPETVAENKSPANPKQEADSTLQGEAGSSTKQPHQSLSDDELNRKLELRKKFSGRFNDVTNIPTLLADKEFREYAGLVFKEAAGDFKHFSKELIESVGEKIKEHLPALHKELQQEEKTRPSKNEETKDRASDLGVELKEPDKNKRGNDVVEDEATKQIKKGYDVPDLIDRIVNEKHAASDTEVAILNKYIDAKEDEIRGHNKKLAEEGTTMGRKAFKDLMEAKTRAEEEFQEAADANRKTGRLTAQALNARKFRFNKENSLENMIAKKREANGGDKLTPEQLSDVTKKFSEMEAAQKALENRLKKVEDQNAKLKAEQVVKRATVNRKKVPKSELASERAKIFDDIRTEFKKIRQSGQAMSDVPYRRELAAVAKHMPALLRNLAQEGVIRIEDVVDNIYAALKPDLDDITKRDVTDLISGKYDEFKPTKSELQDNIRALRIQAKLVNEIADLEKGIKTAKPEVVKKRNAQIEALRERLKQLNKEGEPSAEEKDLAALKKRLQSNIDKISKRISEGDYSKEEKKKPVAMDAEALTLRRKYDKIKQDFDIEVAKDALKQRTKIEKLKDDFLNIASLPRALKASLDFSAVLRQGLFATAGHPREALSAFKEMFRQTLSEEKYRNWLSDLKHSEYYDLMQNSDLYLSDKNDPKVIAREEEFTSNLADKIPGIGKVIAASERAYTGYLNVLRAGVFEQQAKELIKRGYTFENNPEVFKGAAKVVNVLTGRGDIPELLGGKQPKILSNILFSPRFMASRIQTLYLWADPRLPKEARMMAAKDIGATLGVGAILLSLAAASGYKVVMDPRSTNFLKIQDEQDNGTTYYDILGGLPQYIKFLTQQYTGQLISKDDNLTDLTAERGEDNPFGRTRLDLTTSFLRGKLSPLLGAGLNLQQGKDVVGNPYHLWPNVPQEFVPLPYTDVKEAYDVGGIKNALKAFVPSQFGISTSSY